MAVNKDLEIAQAANPLLIQNVASKLGIDENDLETFGKYKAKLPLHLINHDKIKNSKLVLVSALTPTPAGEGKTTVSIGLTEGLNKIGKKATVVLREPSLGPVFGIKGGAAGGGHSQVIPMEDINLHFTGDFSAIEKANNLLAALIDNNIQNPNGLGIDQRTVMWKRVMDMNDRALRKIVIGLGGTGNGIPREDGFNITAASEIMAILCLSNDMEDLKQKLGNIFVGFTFDKKPVYVKDLNAQGSMAVLLKDAIKPNLVQTLEGNPAIIHGGPFANIAQGTNSILATKMGMSHSEYVVTEAGFGSDLGAEKFLDIKCGYAGIKPDAIVLVATIRALRYHGGADLNDINTPNAKAVENGFVNLQKHIENAQQFNLVPVVAINNFITDSEEEIEIVIRLCREINVEAVLSQGWEKGGEGTKELAQAVCRAAESGKSNLNPLYDWKDGVKQKIETIAKKVYGAKSVSYSKQAEIDIRRIDRLNLNELPVCIAKTQKSFSDDETLRGRPKDFEITVNEIEIAAGAGFIIPITGKMMRMPGLPATPAANHMDIDREGKISGLS